jgi:hypothetical protein
VTEEVKILSSNHSTAGKKKGRKRGKEGGRLRLSYFFSKS